MSHTTNLAASGGGVIPPEVAETITTQDGAIQTAVGHNFDLSGNNPVQNALAAYTTGTTTNSQVNSYGTAVWTVNSTAGVGTHTSLAAAEASASAGDTIFMTAPGSYTGNCTISKNLTIVGYGGMFRGSHNNVSIIGKMTINAGVAVTFVNLNFSTNSDYVFDVSAGSADVLTQNCYFNCSNHDGINLNAANANFYIKNCSGLFASTFTLGQATNGVLWIDDSTLRDSTGTPAAMNCAAQSIRISNSEINLPLSTSSTGTLILDSCLFGSILSPFKNLTWITSAGSNINYAYNCTFYSGTASAVSIGTGTTLNISDAIVYSSNTNPLAGAGTINIGKIDFIPLVGGNSNINVTTQVPVVSSNTAIKVTTPGAYPFTIQPQDALIPVNTTSARTINMPATITVGERHIICDGVGTAATNNITIQGNGHNILDATSASSTVINTNGGSKEIVGISSTLWKVV